MNTTYTPYSYTTTSGTSTSTIPGYTYLRVDADIDVSLWENALRKWNGFPVTDTKDKITNWKEKLKKRGKTDE